MATQGVFDPVVFQNNVFQIEVREVGSSLGSSLSGGTFSRGRWRSMVEERERERDKKRKAEERRKRRKREEEERRIAARQAAFAAELLFDQIQGQEALRQLRLAHAGAALNQAQQGSQTINQAQMMERMAMAQRQRLLAEQEEEDEEMILLLA